MAVRILVGDCRDVLATLPNESVHCVVTSPPYFGLRDYGVDGQIGLEATPADHIALLVDVFREVHRVLRADGTVWMNYGDAYCTGTAADRPATTIEGQHVPSGWAKRSQSVRIGTPQGFKTKDLMLLPHRLAIALQEDGWWIRSDIIWHKPNPMPESVTDRPTCSHEHVFLLSKSERYFYDAQAARESSASPDDTGRGSSRYNFNRKNSKRAAVPGLRLGTHRPDRADTDCDGTRNLRNVWTVATRPFGEAHFATMPPELAEPCIKAGCPQGGTVLDPFGGAGTTGLVADRLGRDAILIELNPEYAALARRRIADDAPLFSEVA